MGRGLDGFFIYPGRGIDTRCGDCAVLRDRGGVVFRPFPVALARGKHLFPFRTEQLSPSAPMVLGSQGPGRVGRRRFFSRCGPPVRRPVAAPCVGRAPPRLVRMMYSAARPDPGGPDTRSHACRLLAPRPRSQGRDAPHALHRRQARVVHWLRGARAAFGSPTAQPRSVRVHPRCVLVLADLPVDLVIVL